MKKPGSRAVRFITVCRLFLIVVAVAAIRLQTRQVQGIEILRHLASHTALSIGAGIALTASSFAVLASTEIFALAQVRGAATRTVSFLRGATTGFVAAALGQSVGFSLLTGGAVRIRAYAKHISATDIAQVSTFVTLTATLGLLATGAVSLLVGSDSLVILGYSLQLRWIGVALASVLAAYLAWCSLPGRRRIGPRLWRARRPTARAAVGQVVISSVDWLIVASVLYVLLPHGLTSYGRFLPIFFVAQTIAVVSHVPGGVGVFEAVLIGLLGQHSAAVDAAATAAAIGATLLLYRAIYYLLPLFSAVCVATASELVMKRRAS